MREVQGAVLQGAPPVTPAEEAFLSPEDVNEGLRLACYLAAEDGMVPETLGVGPLEVVTGGAEEVAVNPLVRQVQVGAPESISTTAGHSSRVGGSGCQGGCAAVPRHLPI